MVFLSSGGRNEIGRRTYKVMNAKIKMGSSSGRMNEKTSRTRDQGVTRASVRTVYDFPVAGHRCSDGAVRYIKLVRRSGQQPEGTCQQCNTSFQYRKPKPSNVRHPEGEGIVHF